MTSVFIGLKIFTNVKNICMKREYFFTICFEGGGKKNLKKLKIMLQYFAIGFDLVSIS